MFKLDNHEIVDATRIGNIGRFINHSCGPNAYARAITVAAPQRAPSPEPAPPTPGDVWVPRMPLDGERAGCVRKIVIFAKRPIALGEEVTYDYQFPIEEEKLACYCGAPECKGSMN